MARILIVEDNATNADLMVYLLRAFGHDPVAVYDGHAGLAAAKGGGYDLIVSDVLMPGLDGLELCRRYKAETSPGVPIVGVTALAMVGDKERLFAAGFDGYIAKPIEPETFVAQIERFLPAQPAQAPSAPPVILAVDDVQVNIEVIRGSLQSFGYRVVGAANVGEAIDKANELRPALILCDLHMPEGDGFDFLREVRGSETLHDTPFFFISSTAWRTSDQIRALQLGANKFLIRPIEPQALLDEVEAVLGARSNVENPHR